MKPLLCLPLALALLPPQDAGRPAAVAAGEHHIWLQQLVGDWEVSQEVWMEPGAEPMRMESTESVRPIGDLWVMSEGHADFGGDPFQSVMTLGYDPAREAFVGTWIDTMQPILCLYEGSLDEAGRVLTLAAEGPRFDGKEGTGHYRDAIEVVDSDHKVLTSSVLQPDGSWVRFMRAEFTRVK
jgi:hypothetical protein